MPEGSQGIRSASELTVGGGVGNGFVLGISNVMVYLVGCVLPATETLVAIRNHDCVVLPSVSTHGEISVISIHSLASMMQGLLRGYSVRAYAYEECNSMSFSIVDDVGQRVAHVPYTLVVRGDESLAGFLDSQVFEYKASRDIWSGKLRVCL